MNVTSWGRDELNNVCGELYVTILFCRCDDEKAKNDVVFFFNHRMSMSSLDINVIA